MNCGRNESSTGTTRHPRSCHLLSGDALGGLNPGGLQLFGPQGRLYAAVEARFGAMRRVCERGFYSWPLRLRTCSLPPCLPVPDLHSWEHEESRPLRHCAGEHAPCECFSGPLVKKHSLPHWEPSPSSCALLLLDAGLEEEQQSAMSPQGPFPSRLAWPLSSCAPRLRPARAGEAVRPSRRSSTSSSRHSQSRCRPGASLDFPLPSLWQARLAQQQAAQCRQPGRCP